MVSGCAHCGPLFTHEKHKPDCPTRTKPAPTIGAAPVTAPADMTDAEMNAAVAERVMQWTWTAYDHPTRGNLGFWQTGRDEPNARLQDYDWAPTTDPRNSRMMVERMRELDWRFTLAGGPGGYLAQFFRPNTAAPPMWESDAIDSLDRAICEAALEALSQ